MKDEHDESVTPVEESLAEAMPDPAAPPLPVTAEDPALRAIGVAGVVLVTVGGLLLPLSVATSSTAGATRSAKIKWEERHTELRQAMADEQAAPSRTDQKVEGTCDRDGN